MKEVTIEDLSLHFDAKRKEAAGLMLMLMLLPVGGQFKAINGKIIKTGEDTFQLVVDDETIRDLTEEWVEHNVDIRHELFSDQ